jgi:antitoxin FitA
MASITIRKLPDQVKQDLRERAARNGRSLEEEVRQSLITLVRPEETKPRKGFFDGLYEISRPGVDLKIPPRTRARIPDFSDE